MVAVTDAIADADSPLHNCMSAPQISGKKTRMDILEGTSLKFCPTPFKKESEAERTCESCTHKD